MRVMGHISPVVAVGAHRTSVVIDVTDFTLSVAQH